MTEVNRSTPDFRLKENYNSEQDQATGLWQPKKCPGVSFRRAAIDIAITSPEAIADLTLDQYQEWAELDWKQPHGSAAAVERLAGKIIEEANSEVLAEYDRLAPGESVPYDEKLIDELGDVLWVTSGIASNADVNIMRAVRSRLLTQYIPFKPPKPITLGDIDSLMTTGFQPRVLNAGGVEDYDDELWDNDELEPHMNWFLLAGMLSAVSRQGIGETDYSDTKYYDPKARERDVISTLAADSVLFIAYTAQKWGGGTMQDVIMNNIQKISGRVSKNLIDKTDGERN